MSLKGFDVCRERALAERHQFIYLRRRIGHCDGNAVGRCFPDRFCHRAWGQRLQIGIMAAVPTLCNAAQFIGARILNSTGRAKQLCLIMTWISRLMWVPILMVPMLLSGWSGESKAWVVIGLLILNSAFASIGGLAWLDWIKRLIPESERINFLSRRNWYNSGLSLAMSVGAAVLISLWQTPSASTAGFVLVFAVAMLCGLVGVTLLGKMPSADACERSPSERLPSWREPWAMPNFRRLLLGYSVWQFATQLAAPFYAVYMLQKLEVPFWTVTVLATIVASSAWPSTDYGRVLKLQFGVRPVVLVAILGDLMMPFCWLLVHPQTVWMIVPLHLFAMFNPPLAMGPNNLLLKMVPDRNSASYMAFFNATTGMIGALGAVTGGWLAMSLQGHWQFGAIALTGIQLVFVLSGIGKLGGFALLRQVEETGACSLGEMGSVLLNRPRYATVAIPASSQDESPRAAA